MLGSSGMNGPRSGSTHVDQIAAAVSLDMNQWWKPSEAFFNRVPKTIGIAAVQEVGSNEEVCKGMERATKADAVSTTLHTFAGPIDFRSPCACIRAFLSFRTARPAHLERFRDKFGQAS